jgi:hypothetical protein
MKKKILLFTVVVVVFLAAYLYINKGFGVPETNLSPLDKPNIPKQVQNGYKLKSNIRQDSFTFPERLPVLEIVSRGPYTREEATLVAFAAGFQGQPIVGEDVRMGTTYIWTSNTASLVVYSGPRAVEYARNEYTESVVSRYTEIELRERAERFLSERLLVPKEYFEFTSLQYLSFLGGHEELIKTSEGNAQFYQYDFSPAGSGFKVVSFDPNSTVYTVLILPDGTVQKAQTEDLGELTASTESYIIKNYKEVLETLSEADIITIDGGNIPPSLLDRNVVENVTINDVELAYLMPADGTNVLQPIFILDGLADIRNIRERVSVVLYLPAFK